MFGAKSANYEIWCVDRLHHVVLYCIFIHRYILWYERNKIQYICSYDKYQNTIPYHSSKVSEFHGGSGTILQVPTCFFDIFHWKKISCLVMSYLIQKDLHANIIARQFLKKSVELTTSYETNANLIYSLNWFVLFVSTSQKIYSKHEPLRTMLYLK